MGIFANASALLPGLKPAAFRGLTFFMPDASIEVGRRIVSTYFPGRDGRAVEDLGRDDGPVRVRGLIVGDDYIGQALALQAAMQARGPGTLLHPWLGEMTVVVPEGSGVIHFNTLELRAIRFEVAFMPVPAGVSVVVSSTLSALLSSVSTMLGAAQRLCAVVLGAATMAVSPWSAACAAATTIGALVNTAVAGSLAYPVVGDAVTLALANLQTAAAGAGGADDAAAIAAC
ncbi:DNA circularization N-terminal domain-containing protein, partial [Azorhizobium caulinodans]